MLRMMLGVAVAAGLAAGLLQMTTAREATAEHDRDIACATSPGWRSCTSVGAVTFRSAAVLCPDTSLARRAVMSVADGDTTEFLALTNGGGCGVAKAGMRAHIIERGADYTRISVEVAGDTLTGWTAGYLLPAS